MDLSFIAHLGERPGPFATVYLDATHDAADAAHRSELRWAAAREDLAAQGADGATLDAVAAAVEDAPPAQGRAGRVLVATDGAVVLDRVLAAPPAPAVASGALAVWGPVPDLLPMLLAMPEPVLALVVRVDETGGEILRVPPGGAPETVEHVSGRQHPVHKVSTGGPSDRNVQEHVEETWRRNTAEVAERVDAHVRAHPTGVLLLAGDAPARSRLRDALSARAAALAVDLEHSGGPDDVDDLAAAVAVAVDDVSGRERFAALERYREAAGRGEGFGVEGVDAVLAALRAEQVDTLLLDGSVTRDGAVFVAAGSPTQLAGDPETLRAEGAEPYGPAGVDAAMIRAAAAGGVTVHAIADDQPELGLADGVAAVLRYPFVGTS